MAKLSIRCTLSSSFFLQNSSPFPISGLLFPPNTKYFPSPYNHIVTWKHICMPHLFREEIVTSSSTGRTIRRGVRSGVQLSCTETRFQKCTQSGKNGFKHPMLSISMAFNVISCKKVERNTQKLKIADFTM